MGPARAARGAIGACSAVGIGRTDWRGLFYQDAYAAYALMKFALWGVSILLSALSIVFLFAQTRAWFATHRTADADQSRTLEFFVVRVLFVDWCICVLFADREGGV